MELRIEEFPIATEIHFNFDEIKDEVARKMDYYRNAKYTEADLPQAKADRATLNRFINALDGRRKEIKNEILRPYNEFVIRLDELKEIVEEPKQLIDEQIKAFEASEKEAKQNRIVEIFNEEVGDRGIDLFVIFNNKWLNKTYAESDIREEIQAKCSNYDTDMPMLEQLEDYREEAIKRYKETMDYSQAMGEVYRLMAESEKRKQAEEKADRTEQTWRRLAVFASIEELELVEEYLNNARIQHKRVY